MASEALVIMADGFEEIEAITPIDILRRAGVGVTVAALEGLSATGSHGLKVECDCSLDSVKSDVFDAVVLPGGMPGSKHLGDSEVVKSLVVRHFEADKLVAAICAAPAFALGRFGVLDGKRATCYPGCEAQFPAGVEHVKDRVVVDGNVVTSKGPGTAFAFGLELTRILAGAQKAEDLAIAMQAV